MLPLNSEKDARPFKGCVSVNPSSAHAPWGGLVGHFYTVCPGGGGGGINLIFSPGRQCL